MPDDLGVLKCVGMGVLCLFMGSTLVSVIGNFLGVLPPSLALLLALLRYIVVLAVLLYAAYWAFAIRRALIGRIYRNHALWLGVLCIVALFYYTSLLLYPGSWISPSISNPFVKAFETLLVNAPWAPLILFAFIDSTVPILRRSDPLLRSLLRWGELRLVIWLLLFALLSIYLAIASNFTVAWFVLLSLVVAAIPGAAALLIGGKRTMDMVLRESMKWVGVGVLCLLLGSILISVIETLLGLAGWKASPLGNVVWVLLGYALYRSARSLAPLNRLPPIEPETSPSSTEAVS